MRQQVLTDTLLRNADGHPAARAARPPLRSARDDRSTPGPVRKFRPDIEGLRAVAVTLVVLSHLGLIFPGGYVGVDVFFVISGFLITRQLTAELARTGRISLAGFYARRVRRILPAATVVIVGTVLACWRWDSPLAVKSDALDGLFAAFSGVNWRLAQNGTNYFLSTSPPSPFQHFWSLSVEEQFYAVWPVLLLLTTLLASRKFARRWFGGKKPLVLTLLAIMVVSLMLSVRTTGGSPSWAYFGTQTRAWELAIGALIAVTVDLWTRMPPALASQMSWFGLGMIAVAACWFSSYTVYPGVAVVLPVIGAAFVVAGGCPGWSHGAELILMRRPAQFLGRVSYSWYLVHWPVLTIVPLATGHPLTLAGKMFVLFGSLAIAVALFYLVEQPTRAASLLVRKPRYGLAVGAVMVAASITTAIAASDLVIIPGGGPAHAVTAASGVRVVDNALAAAVRLERLPAHLTPSLGAAPTDFSFTTAACMANQDTTALVPTARCTFGDPHARQTIVVVGDSHANAWSPALDAFAKKYHWRFILFAKAGCPPGYYPTDLSPESNQIYTACNQWRTSVFARLKELRPNVILVISEIRTEDVDPSGMVQSILQLESTGARVIYMEDTPEPIKLGSVPDCLAQHPADIQQCSLARDNPGSRLNAFAPRRLEAAAVQRAGAILIDPSVWFCTATTCPPVIDNIVVYADNTHPTAAYTKWLSPVLSTALENAIRAPARGSGKS
jgi:peptidoglycan/LPS O-acetylase OafA/YrhL